jgi:hypothetical protein
MLRIQMNFHFIFSIAGKQVIMGKIVAGVSTRSSACIKQAGEQGEGGSLDFVGPVLRGGDGGLYWRSTPTEKTLAALLSIRDEGERE